MQPITRQVRKTVIDINYKTSLLPDTDSQTRSSVKMRPHQPNPSCRSKSREAHVVRPISIQRLLTPQLRVYAVGVSWALPSLRRSLLRNVNEITKQSPYSPPADRICLPLDRGIIVLSSIMPQYEHKFDRV
ncbi:hypothetical protein B296_00030688 [Ensete ventricosum]|uniref:Uncharacterized protein n=1 Tax=Ensete ventricosum TaxID=4639 RepID=A0A426Z0T5_ENSVE|nr:hypothetical protein B296_00030688 [Ensete ventricosum]